MDLIFLGPPGAGKGTQAKSLCARLGVRHLSTGDLLRSAVRGGSELGRTAKTVMDQGQLVPDALVTELVRAEVASDSGGLLMDGYPRTLEQAKAFDQILTEHGRQVHSAVFIDVPDDTLLKRISGRRSCPGCGSMYHVTGKPPRLDGRCDDCGGELQIRADDHEAVVLERLEVYARQTRPLLEYYGQRDLLRSVDGTAGVAEVESAILKILGAG